MKKVRKKRRRDERNIQGHVRERDGERVRRRQGRERGRERGIETARKKNTNNVVHRLVPGWLVCTRKYRRTKRTRTMPKRSF